MQIIISHTKKIKTLNKSAWLFMHPTVVVHYNWKSNTMQDVCQHLALWTELPLDPTPSPHHFVSVMHETGRSKMEATSPHSQNHLGPWMSSYLLPQPPSGARSDARVLSPFSESGTLLFPRGCKLPASACFFSWAVVSLKVCPTFKGFGPETIKGWHSRDCGRAIASVLSLI